MRIQSSVLGQAGEPCANLNARQFRVVLVYQDFEMAVQGKALCDALAHEVGAGDAAVLSVWPFHLLHEPELHLAAVRAAEQADAILVANRDTELPYAVKTWLNAWAARRLPGPGGLVVLLPSAAATVARSSQVALELFEAAGRAGMDFFCGTPEWVVAELVRRRPALRATQGGFTGTAVPWGMHPALRSLASLGRSRPRAHW